MREIGAEQIRFKDVIALFIRTWPYLYGIRWHAVAYVGISIFVFFWSTFFGFVNFGMIYNNVILNLPLSKIAAALLFLDPQHWVHVKALSAAQRYELVPMILVLGILAIAVGQIIGFANGYYRVWIVQNVNQKLRVKLMAQLQSLSLKFHAGERTGDTIYRLFQDSAMVTQILQSLIVSPFVSGVHFFIGVGVVAAFSPMLAVAILFTWAPMLYFGKRMSGPLRRGFKDARARNSELTSTIQESIEGIRTVKINGLEGHRQRLFESGSVGAFNAAHHARVRLMLFSFYVFLCAVIPLVFVELKAAVNAYQHAQTFLPDILLGFGFAVWNFGGQDQARARARMAIGSAEGLINLWGRAQDMAMGLNRVFQILDLTPDVVNQPDAAPLAGVRDSISFEHLRFAYPGRPLFEDITFNVRAGTVAAILGPTGVGKTTLMMLLLRMIEYQDGRILLDGRDIRDFTVESVRDCITLATQENTLFSMSVLDNIRYARPVASDAEVMEAARIACADEFIARLPQREQTFLGEKAAKLSTGQRQRLVIARAILKNAPILILDEPTAFLDAETERRLIDNIRVWASNRTVFLVTHRLSAIRRADQIVFLKDGYVADSGSHKWLMARIRLIEAL